MAGAVPRLRVGFPRVLAVGGWGSLAYASGFHGGDGGCGSLAYASGFQGGERFALELEEAELGVGVGEDGAGPGDGVGGDFAGDDGEDAGALLGGVGVVVADDFEEVYVVGGVEDDFEVEAVGRGGDAEEDGGLGEESVGVGDEEDGDGGDGAEVAVECGEGDVSDENFGEVDDTGCGAFVAFGDESVYFVFGRDFAEGEFVG